MCGIFAYSGNKDAAETIHQGLQRLEYRGYDSWGISVLNNKDIVTFKTIYPLDNKPKLPENTKVGIGHTRWATHGGVNHTNAHPHISKNEVFGIAQNGIVENYESLKKSLIKEGFDFKTNTDTEVILKTIEKELQKADSMKTAVQNAFSKLEGRNTIIVLTNSGDLYGIKNGSPLVVGGGGNELFIASDTLSFADKTNKAVVLDNFEMVTYIEGAVGFYNIEKNKSINKEFKTFDADKTEINKGGYDHFMIKEIMEQEYTIKNLTQIKQAELQPLVNKIKAGGKVYTIGAGTAGFAAGQTAFYLRDIAKVNAIPLKPNEFDSFKTLITKKDLVIAFSQSGETADTIEVLEYLRNKGIEIASLVNMKESTIPRISDYSYFLNCGPEICVASTKAFTTKIGWGYLLAKTIIDEYTDAINNLKLASKSIKKTFTENKLKQIKEVAKSLINQDHAFILGTGTNFYIALEGALKIKEVSYKHYEGFSSGELKHGVIALIEKGIPVLGTISDDKNKANMINALTEIKSRGGRAIGVGFKPEETTIFDDFIETGGTGHLSAINNTVPFQLIGYYLAVEQDLNPDKPRNLAKSVTVK